MLTESKFRIISAFAIMLGVYLLGINSPLSSQDQLDSAEIAEMTMKSMRLGKPGPEHEKLAALVGSWKTTTKWWLSRDGEPIVINGMATNELILGGRFLQSYNENTGGHIEISSISILGFDRRHEVFTIYSCDNMGTYAISAQGPYDEESNSTTMSGTDEDPIFKHTQMYDIVLTFMGENVHMWEIIFKDDLHTQGGEPFKMVEVTFERIQTLESTEGN